MAKKAPKKAAKKAVKKAAKKAAPKKQRESRTQPLWPHSPQAQA